MGNWVFSAFLLDGYIQTSYLKEADPKQEEKLLDSLWWGRERIKISNCWQTQSKEAANQGFETLSLSICLKPTLTAVSDFFWFVKMHICYFNRTASYVLLHTI